MAKQNHTLFFCSECGHESSRWTGQCPTCKAWNTMVEAPTKSLKSRSASVTGKSRISRAGGAALFDNKPISVNNIDVSDTRSTSTGFDEFDRVLGGGIVKGSLVLIGGDPGVGKSTLLLQMSKNIASDGRNVLYVSGEESLKQIKMRADRLEGNSDNLKVLCETDLQLIEEAVGEVKPDVIVIDSIQTMYCEGVESTPGSTSQVRESTMFLLRLAKELSITVFIIGHVTKEGVVAGPRVLEHMVDAVLYIEGDRSASYRIVRGVKNRFGSTNEIGVFEMRNNGFVEVLNPSAYMLSGRDETANGSVITCLIEGTRPIMIEVQALVCRSNFGLPRRTASGMDYNRVNLLMAVMEKKTRMDLSSQDAYVNIAGGIKGNEPGLDLAVVLSIASSYISKSLPEDMVVFGEVGLSGEVRAVSKVKQRIDEAVKLSFSKVMCPEVCIESIDRKDGIEYIGVRNIYDAIDYLRSM